MKSLIVLQDIAHAVRILNIVQLRHLGRMLSEAIVGCRRYTKMLKIMQYVRFVSLDNFGSPGLKIHTNSFISYD